MENQNGIPISKRSGFGIATMLLIAKLSESTDEHAALAMILITVLAALYMVADEIKDRRRNGIDKNSNESIPNA